MVLLKEEGRGVLYDENGKVVGAIGMSYDPYRKWNYLCWQDFGYIKNTNARMNMLHCKGLWTLGVLCREKWKF